MRLWVFIVLFLGAVVGLRGEMVLTFGDPETFTDFEYSQTRETIGTEFFSKEVKRYLAKTVKKALPEGAVLTLEIQDIDLAGGFEPWQRFPLNDVRFFRGRYPPQAKFSYRVEDVEGNILAEGEKTLREFAYQERYSGRIGVRGAFYFEMRMLEDWIRRELAGELNSPPSP